MSAHPDTDSAMPPPKPRYAEVRAKLRETLLATLALMKQTRLVIKRWLSVVSRTATVAVIGFGLPALLAYVTVAGIPVIIKLPATQALLSALPDWLVPNALVSLAHNNQSIYLGVAAFGGAIILATAKELATAVSTFGDFYDSPTTASLVKPAAVVFVAFFGLSMSLFAAVEVYKEPVGIGLTFRSEVPPFSPDAGGLMRFHVLFEEEGGIKSISDSTWDRSVQVDGSFASLLRNVIGGLAGCVVEAEDTVKIGLRGYASTSRWDSIARHVPTSFSDSRLHSILDENRAPTLPDAFNVWLADQRVSSVKGILVASRDSIIKLKRGQLIIEPVPASFTSIQEGLQFRDTPGGQYLRATGLFTRRVDLILTRAGRCQR